MIESNWKRIAGVHCQDDGTIAAIWLAHDKQVDLLHLYDCAIFRIEVPAVITEGLAARGRWIPIAWEASAKELADQLLERGLNMLPEPVKDTPALAEVTSREIAERMRTSRFKVEKRLGEWLDEYKSFYRNEAQVPRESYPLMSATRHAVMRLDYARAKDRNTKRQPNYPRVTIL